MRPAINKMGLKWLELKTLVETELAANGVDDAEIDFIDVSASSFDVEAFYDAEDGLAVH